mmetsp:Transcript_120289/g.256752  ORF Transcript_120289/g.256752 Transcript_120289/m.256752 type:complete len:183 (-) Transcript_120289:75-623(-)
MTNAAASSVRPSPRQTATHGFLPELSLPGDAQRKEEKADAGQGRDRLRLPQFEWYLGPMYQRYWDICAERDRANLVQVAKSRVAPELPPEDPWMKLTRPKALVYTFGDAVYHRPAESQIKMHLTAGPPFKRRHHHLGRPGASSPASLPRRQGTTGLSPRAPGQHVDATPRNVGGHTTGTSSH